MVGVRWGRRWDCPVIRRGTNPREIKWLSGVVIDARIFALARLDDLRGSHVALYALHPFEDAVVIVGCPRSRGCGEEQRGGGKERLHLVLMRGSDERYSYSRPVYAL